MKKNKDNISEHINNLYQENKSEDNLDNEINYVLIRKEDGLIKQSKDIIWVDSYNIKTHQEPKVGRKLLMGPFNYSFKWVTTDIIEIIKVGDIITHFKTNNSEYKLYKGGRDIFDLDEFKEWIK